MRLALLLPVLAGCPLLDVEVEVGEVMLSYRDVEVDASLLDAAGGSIATTFVFDDLADIHELLAHDPKLELVRAELRPTSAGASLAFVESARVTLAGDELPALIGYNCDGDCQGASGDVVVPAAEQRDVTNYLRGDSVTVDVELVGRPEVVRWTMDVDVYLRGKLHERIDFE